MIIWYIRNDTIILRSLIYLEDSHWQSQKLGRWTIVTRRQTPRCRAGSEVQNQRQWGLSYKLYKLCSQICMAATEAKRNVGESWIFIEKQQGPITQKCWNYWTAIWLSPRLSNWFLMNIAAIRTFPASCRWEEIMVIICHECEMPSWGKAKHPG